MRCFSCISFSFLVVLFSIVSPTVHAKGESPLQTLGGIPPLPYLRAQAKQSCELPHLRARVQRGAEASMRVAHKLALQISQARGGMAITDAQGRAISKLASQKTSMCPTAHAAFYQKMQVALETYKQVVAKALEKHIKARNACPSIHGGIEPRCEARAQADYNASVEMATKRHIGGSAQAAYSSMIATIKACILHREAVLSYAKKTRLRGTFMMTARSMPVVHWQLAGAALEHYEEACRQVVQKLQTIR